MNKKRLNQLIHLLENHDNILPHTQFNMESWTCGTTACAMGSACLYGPFIEQGLSIPRGEPEYQGFTGYRAAAKFFGISLDNAHYLFDPFDYDLWDTITPETVIGRVKVLLEGSIL